VTWFCKEAILGLNSEDASSSPKDDGLDQVNEVIFLILSDEPSSSVRQIARTICVPKTLYIVGLLILCISQSDIFIGFLTISPIVSSQQSAVSSQQSAVSSQQSEGKSNAVESSRWSNFTTSCYQSGMKDKMEIHMIY
jgi:hypothetical protein